MPIYLPCPKCNAPLQIHFELSEDKRISPTPDPEPDPVPVPEPGEHPLINIFWGGVEEGARSDRARMYFTILNPIEGGSGHRNNPLKFKGPLLKFNVQKSVIPEFVRGYGFEMRLHIQNTGNCARIDRWRQVIEYDELDQVFEFDYSTLAGRELESYEEVDKVSYLLISDASNESKWRYDTSGKLFLQEV